MKQMESAKARIPSPEYSTITTAWSDAMTNIFSSGADVKKELDTAAATIDSLLSE